MNMATRVLSAKEARARSLAGKVYVVAVLQNIALPSGQRTANAAPVADDAFSLQGNAFNFQRPALAADCHGVIVHPTLT